MLGAIIGDIVGSRFEFNNTKTKNFDLFTNDCKFTDDTVMTIAVGLALYKSKNKYKNLAKNTIYYIKKLGHLYPNVGYGKMFVKWLYHKNNLPYNSFGNGAGMRVSFVGYTAKNIKKVTKISDIVTKITHNHPEGIKGARAIASAIFLARTTHNKDKIKQYIQQNFYALNFTLDNIRSHYNFDSSCQNSVPQAIVAFLESTSFEDAIRNAISIGGDSDTIACMAGGIAEAYYGIPEQIKKDALKFLDKRLIRYVNFLEKYQKLLID